MYSFFAGLQRRYLLPAMLLSVVAADIILFKLGFDPTDWIVHTYNFSAITLVALELIFPRNPEWNYFGRHGIRVRETAVETAFFFFSGFWASEVTYPFAAWVADHFRAASGFQFKIDLPILLQALLIIFSVDFIRYWIHRWGHSNAFLWRFQALHHMPERLGAITSTRAHPIDDLLLYFPETLLLMILGFDRIVVAGLFSVIWVISLIKHANLEIEDNWFSRLFQVPRFHLRHHEYQDGLAPTYNFSEYLTFWDRVFGTFRGDPITDSHRVGVQRGEKQRSIVREFFGSLYLKLENL